MKIEQRKALLARLLDSKSRGTRSRLAYFCNVKKDTVSDWLNTQGSWPPPDRESKICEFFGIDPRSFYYEEKTDPSLIRPKIGLSTLPDVYQENNRDKSGDLENLLSSPVSIKKQRLARQLDQKGRGARAELARFCSVTPRMVSIWLDETEKGSWPTTAKEQKVWEFFEKRRESVPVTEPAPHVPEEVVQLRQQVEVLGEHVARLTAQAKQPRAALDYARVLTGLRELQKGIVSDIKVAQSDKVNQVFNAAADAVEALISAKERGAELPALDRAVHVFKTQVQVVGGIPDKPGIHGLQAIQRDLSERMQTLLTGRVPYG